MMLGITRTALFMANHTGGSPVDKDTDLVSSNQAGTGIFCNDSQLPS